MLLAFPPPRVTAHHSSDKNDERNRRVRRTMGRILRFLCRTGHKNVRLPLYRSRSYGTAFALVISLSGNSILAHLSLKNFYRRTCGEVNCLDNHLLRHKLGPLPNPYLNELRSKISTSIRVKFLILLSSRQSYRGGVTVKDLCAGSQAGSQGKTFTSRLSRSNETNRVTFKSQQLSKS